MGAYEKANEKLYEELADTIADIGFDIRMEDYSNAEKKIDLLSKLLKVLKEGSQRRWMTRSAYS